MTTALERGAWSDSRPGRSLPPGKTLYPLYRRLSGPQGLSGHVRKISHPPGLDPRTVEAVASRYTDWATQDTCTYTYLCLQWSVIWSHRILKFPLRTPCRIRNDGRCGILCHVLGNIELSEQKWKVCLIKLSEDGGVNKAVALSGKNGEVGRKIAMV